MNTVSTPKVGKTTGSAKSHQYQFDLGSIDFISNPFPTYEALLKEAPIYEHSDSGFYFVSKPSYVQQILKDNQTFSSDRVTSFASSLSSQQLSHIQPLVDGMSRWLLFQDPPKHMPLRKIINASLNHKLVAKMRNDIAHIAEQLIDCMKAERQSDLVEGFAYPLPAMVIAHLLGVPKKDIHLIKKWSDDIVQFMGEKGGLESALNAQNSIIEMSDYLKPLLLGSQSVASGCDDEVNALLPNLLKYKLEHPEFTNDDVIANCILLLFAGHETTTYLITHFWFYIQKHPDQFSALKNEPDLIPNAVEETLRFDGPVHRLGRMIMKDVEIGGVTLKKGRKVFLMIGAANRSNELNDQANEFDVRRKNIRHMGLGFGPHLCSGAALGRLEAAVAIEKLIDAFPNGYILNAPEYQPNLGVRAIKSLHIHIGK